MNADYFCPRCRVDSLGPVCALCGLTATAKTFAEQQAEAETRPRFLPPPLPVEAQVAAEAINRPLPSYPSIALPQPTYPAIVESTPPAFAAKDVAPPEELEGERQVAEYLADGFEIFMIAGIAGVGKTQLMEAFRGQDRLDRVQERDGLVMPTRVGGIDCHPFPHGQRRAVFVDASGERFRSLSAGDRPLGASEVRLLEIVANGLGGLVLLFNLQAFWEARAQGGVDQVGRERQPQVLINVLRLLRFLRGGGSVRNDDRANGAGHRSLAQRVDAEVERLAALRVPVLLLISHADQLHGLDLPAPAATAWQEPPGRKIVPVGEDPLALLNFYVPELLRALEKHAHSFHVDFCHSLTTAPSGKIVDERSCGVALAREWLLAHSQKPVRTPLLPTRFWLSLDRRFNASRWHGLPPPEPLT
jgi:hypothetical protein